MTDRTRPTLDDRLAPFLLLALVAWEAIRESGRITSGDVFWHLRTGDLILSEGPPRVDTFSWTAAGEAWRPNAWIGDALWATVRSVAGEAGVSLLSGITVVVIALLLYKVSRGGGSGPWASVAAGSIAVVFLAPFIAPRPLLLGLLLLPVAVQLATRYRAGPGMHLALLAALIVLWSNLHGSFVVGVAVIGLIAAGWAFDHRTLARPAAMVVTVFVAGLVNPYGLFSYLQTVTNRVESGDDSTNGSPLALDNSRGIAMIVFMVVTAAALWRAPAVRRQRRPQPGEAGRWETILPIAVLTVGTIQSIRIGSFLLLIAAPVVAAGLSRVRAPGVRRWAGPRRGALVAGLGLAGVILAVQQVPELAHAGDPDPRFPESLVAGIPANCRLLNEYDLGGFIIDRRWPEVLVSQDGRADLYGLEEIQRQESWLNATDASVLDADSVQCVLADTGRPLVTVLSGSGSWEIVGESSQQVLLRRR